MTKKSQTDVDTGTGADTGTDAGTDTDTDTGTGAATDVPRRTARDGQHSDWVEPSRGSS